MQFTIFLYCFLVFIAVFCFVLIDQLVEVADFQILYDSGSNSTSDSGKGVPRLVFRKNLTKIWVGGRLTPPKDRPKCGFQNELCPPPPTFIDEG